MSYKKILFFLICYFTFSGQMLASEKILTVGICGPKPDNNRFFSYITDAEKIIAGTVFNSLFKYSPVNPNSVEPELAESIPKPRMSGGKQNWTFTIRKGVMFHDLPSCRDYELEADDVAYSINLLAGQDNGKFPSGIQVRIESRNRITLILDRPLSPNLFLPKLTGYNGLYIISRKILEEEGLISGTGPFMFVSWTADNCIDLTANKSYFMGMPDIDCVRFVFSSDMLRMEQDLFSGDLDVLIPPKGYCKPVKNDENLKYFYFYSGRFIYLGFNPQTVPFNDVELRKLIAINIDRDAICSQMDGCERLYGLAPQETPEGMTRDEIKKLGLDYGYQEGLKKYLPVRAGKTVDNTVDFCTNDKTVPKEILSSIQHSLADMGLETATGDSASNIQTCMENSSGLKLLSIGVPENIQALLDVLIASGAIEKKYKYLIEAFMKETSNNKQGEILKHAQMKILSDLNILPLLFLRESIMSGKRIRLGYDCSRQPFFTVTEKTGFVD